MVTGPSAPVARRPRAALSRKASSILRGTEVLGRKITPRLAQEIGSQFTTRIEGTCIKHRYGSATIKMYDKFALVLRLETTCNDVSAFKHHRKVEHRKDPASRALAPVKKTIYSLNDLRHILGRPIHSVTQFTQQKLPQA